VYALGFDFVEPQYDANVNAPFIDSTFTVTLKNGAATVNSFTFNAPNDTTAFVWVWSSVAFNRMEIRETIGGNENEFFGPFYSGTTPTVPLPPTALLLSSGLLGLLAWRKKLP
jgi:hypothetical protein